MCRIFESPALPCRSPAITTASSRLTRFKRTGSIALASEWRRYRRARKAATRGSGGVPISPRVRWSIRTLLGRRVAHALRSCLNLLTPENISFMFTTRDVFQLPMGWLNARALWNIQRMFTTRDVSQLPMGWLNVWASVNIEPMSVTRDVFQLPMGWLNAWASSNIEPMSVTRDVSQPPMGWLNARASKNISLMSVTRDVSQ